MAFTPKKINPNDFNNNNEYIDGVDSLQAQAVNNIIGGILNNDQEIQKKQDKLIAGNGIIIAEDGKTISATGGGGSGDVQLYKHIISNNDVYINIIMPNSEKMWTYGGVDGHSMFCNASKFKGVYAVFNKRETPATTISYNGATFYWAIAKYAIVNSEIKVTEYVFDKEPSYTIVKL